MNNELQILHEITPLMDGDALYIADRHKTEFTYPVHVHDVYELNFVEHCAGAHRIVGDSVETIGDYDLVLITSPNLEHVWEQADCQSPDIHEITIQFKFGMGDSDADGFFAKTAMASISHMMHEAQRGLAFPMTAIMKVYEPLHQLSSTQDRFSMLIAFLQILNTLSHCEGAHALATTSFAKVNVEDDSRRILKVKNYISAHYAEVIKLGTLAQLANMSESAFSRFFKLHTGKTLSDYIIDIRLGFAARKLIETNQSVAEIGFSCGYNNLSNFNRIFRRKKGCSPTQFRENYNKIKVIV